MRLRGRYLTCFYCGKRSSIRYDGELRDFLCKACDATNYLDENGEITDPPVVEPSTPVQFAKPVSAPPPAAATDNIFCETCLKNQRLFTMSLAQYLPDDPSHPDYDELERKYYRYRKDLEKRYPQVCPDCAVNVENRIKAAGYTAKTDHLRRMMEKTRVRKAPKRMTSLDLANAAGQWLWWGGFMLQMLWHLINVLRVLEISEDGMYDPDDQSPTKTIISWLNRLPAFLPALDTLMGWSITTAFLSAWWNPHFVQVNRGFTRHLLGFTQWYSFQGLIIFFRYLFRSVLEMQGGKAQSKGAQLSAHFAMASIMGLIYLLAMRSIKVDTTPLFGVSERTVSSSQMPSPARQMGKKIEEPKTLAEELTAALESANTTPVKDPISWQNQNPLPPPRVPNNPFRSPHDDPTLPFGSLGISKPSTQRMEEIQDPDAMDWSPIPKQPQTPQASQYRAFQESPTPKQGLRPFGESPTQPNSGPFWFKVPAAPVNPAQRIRNPPNAPLLKPKLPEPVEPKGLHFGKRGTKTTEEGGGDGVDFKNPSFFAPQQADEADALADALGQSFSFGNEAHDDIASPAKPEGQRLSASVSSTGPVHSLELYLVGFLLPLWFSLAYVAIPYCREIQLAVLSTAGIIVFRSIGSASLMTYTSPGLFPYILSAASVLELSAICWAIWQVWTGASEVPLHGVGILVAMMAHQAAVVFSTKQHS